MAKFNLRIDPTKGSLFVFKSPQHISYGAAFQVTKDQIQVKPVRGNIDGKTKLSVLEKIDDLPIEFFVWYAAILSKLNTVNMTQGSTDSPILPEELVTKTSGLVYY